jgi:hypothetical protein
MDAQEKERINRVEQSKVQLEQSKVQVGEDKIILNCLKSKENIYIFISDKSLKVEGRNSV